MKTNTKIIATLGVVAGLGIASIPAFSYAANVSGNVKVEAEINPSLAMRIHSNADAEDTYGFIGYNPATAQGSTDPAATAEGVASQATGLSLSSNQADTTTLYSNISVRSNTGKFKVEVQDADTDTAMRNSSNSDTTNEYIPAGVTTTEENGETVINPGIAGWALKGGDIASWSAITASTESPLTIKALGTNNTSELAYSSDITVNYAVSSGLTKTGIYNDTITYTATALDSGYTLDPYAAAFASCGENAGDECTVDGVNYIRLADNHLWTKNSQGTSAWSESTSDTEPNLAAALCPAGTHLPTYDEQDALVQAYSDEGLYNATGWSSDFWSATEVPSDPSDAWRLSVSENDSYWNVSDKTHTLKVVCVR